MKDVTSTKSLSDLRTAITTRVHSKPPQRGTAHLDLYLLSREKQRLEKELLRLQQRHKRLQQHLGEIRRAMATLNQDAEQEGLSPESGALPAVPERQSPPLPECPPQSWKKMALGY